MNYNYTEEARAQLNKETKKITSIKYITGLDGDIKLAASKIIDILKDEANSTKKTFHDYLERYLVTKYMIDTENIVSFVQEKQDERKSVNGKKDLLTKQRIVECIGNKNFIPQKRDFAFRLAFILGMNDEECEELLTKALNERGFNFKNPLELIYWYCLKFDKGFSHADYLLDVYIKMKVDPVLDSSSKNTCDVYNDITLMFKNSANKDGESEKIILDCLADIKSKYAIEIIGEKKEFVKALGKIRNKSLDKVFREKLKEIRDAISLYNSIQTVEDDEVKNVLKSVGEKFDKTRQVSTNGTASLYDVAKFLYRDCPEYESLGVEKYITDIKESIFDLPMEIKSNRLTKERLHHLAPEESDGKDRYVQRQDLITILFLYYELISEDEQDRQTRFEDFSEESNKKLNICGMLSLNPNNLYEYFIMLCMYTDDPLGTFQEVFVQSVKKEV